MIKVSNVIKLMMKRSLDLPVLRWKALPRASLVLPCVLWCAALIPTAPYASAAMRQAESSMVPRLAGADTSVTLSSPLEYQVFQRRTRLHGAILVRGRISVKANRVMARIIGNSLTGPLAGKWKRLHFDKAAEEFHASLATTAGGFYMVDVKVMDGKRTVAQASVQHVGVGEVFIVSGQSNSTNYGETKQKTETGMVTTFGGTTWRLANDPQPGVQDGSRKGSFIPPFGDALYRRYKVPIGIASVGHGSMSVRQWLPAGENVEVMPTKESYVLRGADGKLTSDGTLFDGMVARMKQLGAHGFRAVLWHQGESDADQPAGHNISPQTYSRMLTDIIQSTRKVMEWKMPWFVAEATYHSPSDPSCPPIRQAQQSLWKSVVALEGPDTDTLTSQYRQNNGKGVHFNDAGLKAHGRLWALAVEAYLDKVLK